MLAPDDRAIFIAAVQEWFDDESEDICASMFVALGITAEEWNAFLLSRGAAIPSAWIGRARLN